MHDVIIIGGGVIGLAIARELAQRKSVLLLDRGATGQGASRAAAGMLAPLGEAEEQSSFLQLCLASHALYPKFVEDVERESGIDVGYAAEGLLCLASTEEGAATLYRRLEWQKRAGFELERLTADEVHRMEPLVTVPVSEAVFIPGESSVVPRRLVNALREACFSRGVEMRTGLRVEGISPNCVQVGRMSLEASSIVIASGVWSAEFRGLNPRIPVHPCKGQILSIGMPDRAFTRMIRWGRSYFVPRPTGELVIGATSEDDAGFDLSLTPAGLGRLLMDAQEISAHTGSYPILETWAGLRPATPDGLPILGQSALPGVYYATGHHRNGVLLAPVTASIVGDLLDGRPPSVNIEPYSPFRF
jgi:glycine oxidase